MVFNRSTKTALTKPRFKSTVTKDSSYSFSRFGYFLPLQTRWNDNDQYGHVNNAVYYEYIDTVVNNYLQWHCALVTRQELATEVGFMVNTNCSYQAPVQYPDVLLGALSVEKIGQSSVTYRVGIFKCKSEYFLSKNAEETCEDCDPFVLCGIGLKGRLKRSGDGLYEELNKHFGSRAVAVGKPVHVFVYKKSGRPVEQMPEELLAGLKKVICVGEIPKL